MKLSPITAFAISIASSAMISPATLAGYTCSTDYFGNTTCSGTINGQSINTTTSTDYFGNTTTTGTVGGEYYSESCSTDYFGNTTCY